jgi:general secretion pathway protein H
VLVPGDVTFDAALVARCNQRPAGSEIRFFPSGMSCGGVIALSRSSISYEVRVNWLTGGVQIVEFKGT